MTYYQQLHPWCIIRLMPNMQRLVVARFRRRNDAAAYVQALYRLEPALSYDIIFDPTFDQPQPGWVKDRAT